MIKKKENKGIKIPSVKCLKQSDGSIIHSWFCNCEENYWETEKGKQDKNYVKRNEKYNAHIKKKKQKK